jgi:hypothetical protein
MGSDAELLNLAMPKQSNSELAAFVKIGFPPKQPFRAQRALTTGLIRQLPACHLVARLLPYSLRQEAKTGEAGDGGSAGQVHYF